VSGNGIRAARREKFLSKPLENGKTPFPAGSGAFLRRLAHSINRQIARNELAQWVGDFCDDLQDNVVQPVRREVQLVRNESDWMVQKASRCAAVHVTGSRVFFHR
jgi:hypothetical protein